MTFRTQYIKEIQTIPLQTLLAHEVFCGKMNKSTGALCYIDG